jgi:ankyrin repeat protein
LLEQNYESLFITDEREENILGIAARYGNIDVMKYLIAMGYDIDGKIETWHPPLEYAIMNGQNEAVKYLLSQGAQLRITDSPGNYDSTLRYAVEDVEGSEVVELVYNAREGDINQASIHEAIEMAIVNCNNEALKFLLDKSLERGYTLQNEFLDFACMRDYLLRDFRKAPNARSELAVESVKLILSSGADVDGSAEEYNYEDPLYEEDMDDYDDEYDGEYDGNYGGPLVAAARSGETDIVKLLIDRGADVNACGTGESPLTLAVKFGYLDIVKMLIENGAKIDNEEEDFGKAIDLLTFAKNRGSDRIYEYLKSVAEQ